MKFQYCFGRANDAAQPATPGESRFRNFDLRCHKCRSAAIAVQVVFDEDAGDCQVVLVCQNCRNREMTTPK